MTNAQMIPNRYLRWATARRLVARIQQHLLNGGTVVMGTYTRATSYKRAHAEWFTATRSGAYVRSGKGRVCIDYCGFRFV